MLVNAVAMSNNKMIFFIRFGLDLYLYVYSGGNSGNTKNIDLLLCTLSAGGHSRTEASMIGGQHSFPQTGGIFKFTLSPKSNQPKLGTRKRSL